MNDIIAAQRRYFNSGATRSTDFRRRMLARLEEAVGRVFDLRPAAIIRDLDLRRPIYRQIAAYGHFGRSDLDLPWEKLDRVEELKAALGV